MPKLPNPTAPRGVGRPTKYEARYVRQVRKLCELGAIDTEIAEFFSVSVRTIANWKVIHPDFADAVRLGKAVTDDRVERTLFGLATGYSFDTVKIVAAEGRVHSVPFVEHIPPSVVAAKFWLCNRRPAEWRLTPQSAAEPPPDLLAQIAADAPRFCPDEPGPEKPIL